MPTGGAVAAQAATLSSFLWNPAARDRIFEIVSSQCPFHRARATASPIRLWVSRHRRCQLCRVPSTQQRLEWDSIWIGTTLPLSRRGQPWSKRRVVAKYRMDSSRCVQVIGQVGRVIMVVIVVGRFCCWVVRFFFLSLFVLKQGGDRDSQIRLRTGR